LLKLKYGGSIPAEIIEKAALRASFGADKMVR